MNSLDWLSEYEEFEFKPQTVVRLDLAKSTNSDTVNNKRYIKDSAWCNRWHVIKVWVRIPLQNLSFKRKGSKWTEKSMLN